MKERKKHKVVKPSLANKNLLVINKALPFFSLNAPKLQKQNTPPAASQVRDTRTRVRTVDRTMFDSLRAFIQSLPQRFQSIIQNPPASKPWISSQNPHVQEVMNLLTDLIKDLRAENIIIRFDQPAGAASASYEYLNNIMRLRPFQTNEERNAIAANLFHEYTHLHQDRLRENRLVAQRAPQVQTRNEALLREIDARRTEVYFFGLMEAARVNFGPAALYLMANNNAFINRFETARAGATPNQRSAAASGIRSQLGGLYSNQIDRNTSIRTYSVTIANNNHIMLHHDIAGQTSPHDLGEMLTTITSAAPLGGHIRSAIIRTLPFFRNLFNKPGGGHFAIASFIVTYNNRYITEFRIDKP